MQPTHSPHDAGLPTVRIPLPRYSAALDQSGQPSSPQGVASQAPAASEWPMPPPAMGSDWHGPHPPLGAPNHVPPAPDASGYAAPNAAFTHPSMPERTGHPPHGNSSDRPTRRSRSFGLVIAGLSIGLVGGLALGIAGTSAIGGGGFMTAAEPTPTPTATPTPTRPASPIPAAVEACDLEANLYVWVGDGGDSLTIDTQGETSAGVPFSDLWCVLDELDVPDSVISRISNTRALDGIQDAAWEDFTASWNYHPDSGLWFSIEFVPEWE